MSMNPFANTSIDEALLLFLLQDNEDNAAHLQPNDELTLKNTDGDFVVRVDVQHFRPEELKVTLEDNFLVIEGRHDEKMDEHGIISRQFVRKYRVPENISKSDFRSSLSSDGILTVISKNMLDAGPPTIKERKPLESDTHEDSFD